MYAQVWNVHFGFKYLGYNSFQGFTGVLCEENIDNCDPDPCHHGQCQDGIDSYTCICNPGYMGTICSDQIDECYSSPCLNEGRCIDLVNGYQCNCQPGTSGKPTLHCLWSFHCFSKTVYTDVSDFLSTCLDTKNIVLILRSTARNISEADSSSQWGSQRQ